MAPVRRESFTERRERRAAIDDPEIVLAAAARFLEARARSVGEVRRRLTQAGYRPELIDGAISRLTELGVLDDEAFARSWIESRDRARPRGESALRQELALKGVAREVISAALAERRGDERSPEGGTWSARRPADEATDTKSPDEVAAWRLLERRGSTILRTADPRARRHKAYALLARNGFDPSTCGSVASAWLSRVEGPDQP
ncbi:MAG TPA: regulatory protein RecX [Vitreimonas sp.]|nr:regulatory protein RecX [Vitreimonas sp.]